MDLAEARRWFASTQSEALQQSLEDDTDEALAAFDRTIGGMGDYPSSVVSEYRRAAATLRTAAGPWNRAVNELVNGRARDGRAALSAYRAYVAALLQLQGANARNAAFVEANVATLIAAVFTAGANLMNARIRREQRDMQRDLERLRDNLARARRMEIGAQLQRGINVLASATSFVLGLLTGYEEAAAVFAAGSAATTTALDFALGPGSPDIYGAANTSASALSSMSRDIPRAGSAFISAGTGVFGFMADTAEVGEAQALLREAQRSYDRACSLWRQYNRHIASAASELTIAKRLADGAVRTARARARAYREAEGDWRELQEVLSGIR